MSTETTSHDGGSQPHERRETPRVAFAPLLLIVVLTAGCTPHAALHRDADGLESPSADVRRESALELGAARVNDPELRQRLTRRLAVMAQSDPDPLVRSAALTALDMQQPQAALDLAKRLRTDADPMVRLDAVLVMGRHGDASVIDVLIQVAREDPSERVRREAVRTLGRHDDPHVITVLIEKLADDSPSVAHAAREALMNISGGVDFGQDAEGWRKWLE